MKERDIAAGWVMEGRKQVKERAAWSRINRALNSETEGGKMAWVQTPRGRKKVIS